MRAPSPPPCGRWAVSSGPNARKAELRASLLLIYLHVHTFRFRGRNPLCSPKSMCSWTTSAPSASWRSRRSSRHPCWHGLLVTGEPCGQCDRYAIDHGLKTIYVAVDRDEVAALGFDYRASYRAFGVTDTQRATVFAPLPVERGTEPFTRYLHINLSGRALAPPDNRSKGPSR